MWMTVRVFTVQQSKTLKRNNEEKTFPSGQTLQKNQGGPQKMMSCVELFPVELFWFIGMEDSHVFVFIA